MKQLKRYQEEAVDKLLNRATTFLQEKVSETIVFQAPTGSGKTFMATKFISELIKIVPDDLCFLWVSIGKGELHKQSMNSVKREVDPSVSCSILEEDFFGYRNLINQNEVVFLNWEKIRAKDKATGTWKNIAMQDRETINFIDVLENTRAENRKIILIIDESHFSAKSERALEIRDEIVKPDLTLEMSATPVLIGMSDSKVVVNPNDVIEEGMIKKQILINPEVDSILDDELDSQNVILELAVRKREELAKKYRTIGSKVNPLVLIQLPNSSQGEDKKNAIISFLRERNITEESGKVAIWLSDEKVNNESDSLVPIDSKVEYLIFKQAIDTGWDCPRAQVLVKFRESNSIIFEIQTLGRILRMPEAVHYADDSLNTAYVFTNIKSIEVKQEIYNPNIIKTLYSKRKDTYTPIKLKSYYRQRIDYGDITSIFYSIFEKSFCEYFNIEMDILPDYYKNMQKLKQKNVIIDFDKMDSIISNAKLKSVEVDKTKKLENFDLYSVNYSDNDLQNQFENIIKNNLNGFAPRRSISTVKQAIILTIKKQLNLNVAKGGIIYIQSLVVRNESIFGIILDKATKAYKKIHEDEVRKRSVEKIDNNWEIPISKNYNPVVNTNFYCSISLYDPFYIRLGENQKPNELEVEFLNYIDKNREYCEWIWQNGQEHMESNFGIQKSNGYTFQPDFIIKFKDGRIGIFDTKAIGQREDDNKEKADALYKYLVDERYNGKNIIGGLVVKDKSHFRVNMSEIYRPFAEASEEWEYFDNLFK